MNGLDYACLTDSYDWPLLELPTCKNIQTKTTMDSTSMYITPSATTDQFWCHQGMHVNAMTTVSLVFLYTEMAPQVLSD